jgi:hypothetical protein
MTATIGDGEMYFYNYSENINSCKPENSDHILAPHAWLCCSFAAIIA